MKYIFIITILIGGVFSSFADPEMHPIEQFRVGIKTSATKIKKESSVQVSLFNRKNSNEQINYLAENWNMWVLDIKMLEDMYSLDKEIAYEDQLQLRMRELRVFSGVHFLHTILSTSDDIRVTQKTVTILKDLVTYKSVRLYVLSRLNHFDMRPNLLHDIDLQFKIVDIIEILLEERQELYLVNKLINKLLNFKNKDLTKYITRVIKKVLNNEKLLFHVILKLQKALDSVYPMRIGAVIAIREILSDYPDLQRYVYGETHITQVLNKLISMLLPDMEASLVLRKSVIYALGHIKVMYLPVIEALLKTSYDKDLTIRTMSIKALTDLPTDGMHVLKELTDILTHHDEIVVKVLILKLFATKLGADTDTYNFIEKALDDAMAKHGAVESASILLANQQVPVVYKKRIIAKLKQIKDLPTGDKLRDIVTKGTITNILNNINTDYNLTLNLQSSSQKGTEGQSIQADQSESRSQGGANRSSCATPFTPRN